MTVGSSLLGHFRPQFFGGLFLPVTLPHRAARPCPCTKASSLGRKQSDVKRCLCPHCHLMGSLSIKVSMLQLSPLPHNCCNCINKMAQCDYIKLWANSLNGANLWVSFWLLQSHVSCLFPLYICKPMYVTCCYI